MYGNDVVKGFHIKTSVGRIRVFVTYHGTTNILIRWSDIRHTPVSLINKTGVNIGNFDPVTYRVLYTRLIINNLLIQNQILYYIINFKRRKTEVGWGGYNSKEKTRPTTIWWGSGEIPKNRHLQEKKVEKERFKKRKDRLESSRQRGDSKNIVTKSGSIKMEENIMCTRIED